MNTGGKLDLPALQAIVSRSLIQVSPWCLNQSMKLVPPILIILYSRSIFFILSCHCFAVWCPVPPAVQKPSHSRSKTQILSPASNPSSDLIYSDRLSVFNRFVFYMFAIIFSIFVVCLCFTLCTVT